MYFFIFLNFHKFSYFHKNPPSMQGNRRGTSSQAAIGKGAGKDALMDMDLYICLFFFQDTLNTFSSYIKLFSFFSNLTLKADAFDQSWVSGMGGWQMGKGRGKTRPLAIGNGQAAIGSGQAAIGMGDGMLSFVWCDFECLAFCSFRFLFCLILLFLKAS